MKLTWYGQSAFRVDIDGASILIDPFLSGNPLWKQGWEGPAEGVTHVLLTHGHNDHFGDSIAILKKTGAHARRQCRNIGLCRRAGRIEKDQSRQPWRHRRLRRLHHHLRQALHSSVLQHRTTARPSISAIRLGLVLHFPDDKTLYHMGDTDIFSDMALINELHEPKIGLVPVGDRFTMGGAVAALACRRFFKFETVIPCHYKTFGLLDQTPDKFVEGMEGSGVKVVVPESARRWSCRTAREVSMNDVILKPAVPILFVRDVPASAAFFREKLGFEIDFLHGNPPFYGSVSRGDACLHLRCVARAELRRTRR